MQNLEEPGAEPPPREPRRYRGRRLGRAWRERQRHRWRAILRADQWQPLRQPPVQVHWPPAGPAEQQWVPAPENAEALAQYALALTRRARRVREQALRVAELAEAAAAALNRAEAVTAVQDIQRLHLAHRRLRDATADMAATAVVIALGLESNATVIEWRIARRQPCWVRCMAAVRRAWNAVRHNRQPVDATLRQRPVLPRAG